MRIVLYQPDIPQNTGTILRTAACLGISVDVVAPAGFDLSDRGLRRAALDYRAKAALTRHASWHAYKTAHVGTASRLVLLTTQGTEPHHTFAFQPEDRLLFGRETSGVPQAVHDDADYRVRIPIDADTRSLNLAQAVAIVVSDAMTKCRLWPEPGAETTDDH